MVHQPSLRLNNRLISSNASTRKRLKSWLSLRSIAHASRT